MIIRNRLCVNFLRSVMLLLCDSLTSCIYLVPKNLVLWARSLYSRRYRYLLNCTALASPARNLMERSGNPAQRGCRELQKFGLKIFAKKPIIHLHASGMCVHLFNRSSSNIIKINFETGCAPGVNNGIRRSH